MFALSPSADDGRFEDGAAGDGGASPGTGNSPGYRSGFVEGSWFVSWPGWSGSVMMGISDSLR